MFAERFRTCTLLEEHCLSQKHIVESGLKEPVYMIPEVKIAHGAEVAIERSRQLGGHENVGIGSARKGLNYVGSVAPNLAETYVIES